MEKYFERIIMVFNKALAMISCLRECNDKINDLNNQKRVKCHQKLYSVYYEI